VTLQKHRAVRSGRKRPAASREWLAACAAALGGSGRAVGAARPLVRPDLADAVRGFFAGLKKKGIDVAVLEPCARPTGGLGDLRDRRAFRGALHQHRSLGRHRAPLLAAVEPAPVRGAVSHHTVTGSSAEPSAPNTER
jgi:hypothetical protein